MNHLDVAIFRSINDLAGRFSVLDFLGVVLAKYSVVALAIFLLIKWFQKRGDTDYRSRLIIGGFVFVLAEAVGKLLGSLFYHVQPFAALAQVHQLIDKQVNNSFPSDHTILFFSLMMVLVFKAKSGHKIIYFSLASLVGLSRIFVGVHYPSDVLAGALTAMLISGLLIRLLKNNPLLRKLIVSYESIETIVLDSFTQKRGKHSKKNGK